MKETLALIEQLLEEHKGIKQDVQHLERVANDAGALKEIDAGKEDFVPGRFDQGQGLRRLRAALDEISRGLDAHFSREETGLLAAFESHGDEELAVSLRTLLREHEDLRERLAYASRYVGELSGGGLARHLWEASANDIRAHLSHTRKLIEAHAEAEQELFHQLKKRLQGK